MRADESESLSLLAMKKIKQSVAERGFNKSALNTQYNGAYALAKSSGQIVIFMIVKVKKKKKQWHSKVIYICHYDVFPGVCW